MRVQSILEQGNRWSELSDDVALHLDECLDCRRRFDFARVDLDPAVFERLGKDRREAIVAALAGVRAATGRQRQVVVAAAVAAVASVLVLASLAKLGGGGESEIASALVEDHIRYLHAEDRESNEEPAAVVATLQSYVDFQLQLPELGESGLTGGRRCYLLGRRVALLFYETPVGAASYFVLEGDGLDPPGTPCEAGRDLTCCKLKGYRVLSWEEAGLLFAVVGPDSDLVEQAARAARDSVRP